MSGRVDLFFDLGDTLVDLRPLIPAMAAEIRHRLPTIATQADRVSCAWVLATIEATSKAHGSTFRPGSEIAGMALLEVAAGAGVTLALPEATRFVREAWEAYVPVACFHDDVANALESLRSKANVMGIVTDSDSAMVEPLLRRLKIRDVFNVVVVSDQVGAYKPDPRIYLAALRDGGTEAGLSLFVSDSPTDLEGARAVGMGTVWVRRGMQANPQIRGRDWVVRDFIDLRRFLDSTP